MSNPKNKSSKVVKAETEMEIYSAHRKRVQKFVTWIAIGSVFITTFITYGVITALSG